MKISKYLIALFAFLSITSSAFTQDIITIQNEDFTLEVQKTYVDAKPFYDRKISNKNQVINFHFRGSMLDILERWISAMEMESIEFEIDAKRYRLRLRNFEDSTLIFNKFYDVVLTNKQEENPEADFKQIQRNAFEAFIDLTEIKLKKKKESKTFWELRLIDENTPAISMEQDKFWGRSDLEEYIYYERISVKRVADLLGRKLDSFVRPISRNSIKYDIRMPYSNDFFDLKYSMIEHGFELMEVTKEIEVWVIKI